MPLNGESTVDVSAAASSAEEAEALHAAHAQPSRRVHATAARADP
eukprot:CAMPEP_0170151080 /NCGR_PEP_ID=MMETSP0033_2-20121228/48524_1 /TAXON_ID=195969 /ORGANISM="Dolichomastix tenuilepis, Strain CCMP3274" /LENGTH=44 /DNA_ID= /DNA_START= /DNA_END= /DNA_ORIENTATION=